MSEKTISLWRPCPICQKIIEYSSKNSFRDAIRNASTCLSCRPTKPKLTSEQKSQRKLEMKFYLREYREENKLVLAGKRKDYMNSVKEEGIKAYGGRCTCCGEAEHKFLTLEHLEGRNKDEKRLTGKKAWLKAKSENYPDTYTVLCFNCNCAKGAFGICPHKEK